MTGNTYSALKPWLTWSACPRCNQSATGVYRNKLTCVRCHWNPDQDVPRQPEFSGMLAEWIS